MITSRPALAEYGLFSTNMHCLRTAGRWHLGYLHDIRIFRDLKMKRQQVVFIESIYEGIDSRSHLLVLPLVSDCL
jgi:hypothetical protein